MTEEDKKAGGLWWRPHDIPEFNRLTAAWSSDEIVLFIRILDHEWQNGPFPFDMVSLARIGRMPIKKVRQIWPKNVSKQFDLTEQNLLQNDELEKARKKRIKRLEELREMGKRGAEKRWEE
jgi:uncharacterized protein YdaU (DUF1376 family)